MVDFIHPNIIWIFGDQHRAQSLGCNGDENLNTPNFDLMAKEGFNFNKAVAGFPLCCPFRGSLLTSKYPHKSVPGHKLKMPDQLKTIADVYNENGYHTAYFGKWHVSGYDTEDEARFKIIPRESRARFDQWLGYENNNRPFETIVHGHDAQGNEIESYQLQGYETDILTNELMNSFNEQKERDENQPFFSVLSVQPPHNPYFAPDEYMDKHFKEDVFEPKDLTFRKNVPDIPKYKKGWGNELAGYNAIVENIDWNIGRVLHTLKESGLDKNTYVIYFSDHGDMLGSHGFERKTSPYEESIRIPFIVWGNKDFEKEKKLSTGKKIDVPLNAVDIATTSLGLCNIPIPSDFEGYNYSHYCKGEGEKDEDPESAYIMSVISTGQGLCTDKPWRGIITRDGWKYACFDNSDWILYDLNNDPYEMMNLAHYGKYHMYKNVLREMLSDWVEKTGDEFTIPSL